MTSSPGSGARWLRALVSLLIMAGAFTAGWFMKPTLGLDLSGGTQIVLETRDADDGTEANAANTDRVVEVLRNRVDSLGVGEATLSRSGENRIIVELPGVQDPTEAAQVLGQTAQLTIHPVLGVDQSVGTTNGMFGDFGNAPADEANAPADGTEEAQEEEPAGGEESGGAAQQEAPAADPVDPADIALTLPDESGSMLQLGKAALTGEQVASAEAGLNELQTEWMVNVEFRGDGRDAWKELTGDAACNPSGDPKRRIAIVLDNEVISSPEVTTDVACDVGMSGGRTSITGSFDSEAANELALLIEGGSLPLPVEEVQRQTVGPTLGAEAIKASFIAGLIGVALTAVYISVAYRFAGFLASIALLCYTVLSYAALVALGATLTLPGLAGFVLAIGMAIDANVLIFERTREEYQRQEKVYQANKSAGMVDATEKEQDEAAAGVLTRRRRRAIPPNLLKAFTIGSQKAWSAVLDTNVTTLIAAALLFFLASGTVQGFGVTLGLGTIASMISALLIARVLMEWAVSRATPARRLWLIGAAALVVALVAVLSDGLSLDNVLLLVAGALGVLAVSVAVIPLIVRKFPASSGIAHISAVRRWLVKHNPDLMKRSALWLGVTGAITLLALLGLVVRSPNLGVEFTGGRVMTFSVTEELNADQAREVVADAGYPGAVVQEVEGGAISVRTGQISDGEAAEIEGAIAEQGGDVQRTSDEKIGPSMGDELRNKALIALIAALVLQMAYLAWRFRWSFGLSTMLALAFDIVLVVGLFAWLGKPIDGVFLAAVLSIIGFSVNDSVVVFDRVRDEWAHTPKAPFRQIANTAILHTLPRTVNSGIGGLFILAALAVLGGSSLTDFSVAMLVGLVSGMFSTVFVAVPLAIWLQRFDRTPPPHVVKERKTKQRKELRVAREKTDGAVV